MNDRPKRSTAANPPPAKKTAPATKTVPANKTAPAKKTPQATTTAALWSRVKANPGYAPELLARSAVAVYGPVARAWADRVRSTYPNVTPDAVARLATVEHARYPAASGVVASLGGLLGPLAGAAAVAALQARLALHIAAAHGVDPTDPQRAVDLLVLTQVHPDARTAQAALQTAEQTAAEQTAAERTADAKTGTGTGGQPRPLEDAAWRAGVPLLRILGGWAGRRAFARVVPGAALVLGATADADAIRALAARATQHYR